MNKYYQVIAKCGHVGRNSYIEIAFPIAAEDIHEATRLARYLPRVKHHMKDAISFATEITKDEFQILKEQNKANPYLKCKSIQDQRLYCDDIFSLVKRVNKQSAKTRSHRALVGFKRQKEREYLESLLNDFSFFAEDLCAALAYR